MEEPNEFIADYVRSSGSTLVEIIPSLEDPSIMVFITQELYAGGPNSSLSFKQKIFVFSHGEITGPVRSKMRDVKDLDVKVKFFTILKVSSKGVAYKARVKGIVKKTYSAYPIR